MRLIWVTRRAGLPQLLHKIALVGEANQLAVHGHDASKFANGTRPQMD
jgi:hypothetical protein